VPAVAFRRALGPRAIRRIVIHITAGRANIAGPISWFQNPQSGVSAHYIVGQDGEVVQMVHEADVAFHARSANSDSIGIEHVARPAGTLQADDAGLMPTDAQYAASTALVRHLALTHGVPLDRAHIQGHREADPQTTHTGCPDGAWDWDRYMSLVLAPEAASQGLQARMPVRPLATEAEEVDVKLRVFIPSHAIAMDLPMMHRLFGGDGRGFAYEGGTSRAQIHATLRMPTPTAPGEIIVLERSWGESIEYDTGAGVAVAGMPAWYKDLTSGAMPTARDALTVTDGNLSIRFGGTSTQENVLSFTLGSTLVSFNVAGALPLATLAPDIDATLYLHLKVEQNRIKASLRGSHDGFPAYELYVNGQRVYAYDPVAAGDDPIALMAPEDVDVDTNWIDCGYRQDATPLIPVRVQSLAARTLGPPQLQIPPAHALEDRDAAAVRAALTSMGGALAWLPDALIQADEQAVSIGIGPVVDPGPLAGGALGAGVVFAPGNVTGAYGTIESVGALVAALAAGAQATVMKGGLEAFAGSMCVVSLSAAEDRPDRAALLDDAGRLQGISVRLGADAALDPVALFLAERQAYATAQAQTRHRQAARALAGQSFSLNWDEVELIPQPTDKSCWATAAAMVIGWRDRVSIAPETMAEIWGRVSDLHSGLNPSQVETFAQRLGLVFEYPQSYTIEAFRNLLENNGPLWVGAAVPGLHAVVVTGLYADGAQAYVRVTDPWDRVVGSPGAPGDYLDTHNSGSRYILTWDAFVQEYERAATDFTQVNIQILHAGGMDGREPNRGRVQGYAMGLAARARLAPAPAARSFGNGQLNGSSITVEAVSGSDGVVSWQLDQLRGLKRPAGEDTASTRPVLDAPTIRLDTWPYLEPSEGGRVAAGFTVAWRYDGRGVGDVRIAPAGTSQAAAWRLAVAAQVVEQPEPAPNQPAAIGLRFRYVFTGPEGAQHVGLIDLILRGDGRFDQQSRWEAV
jgi:hypothetical protein